MVDAFIHTVYYTSPIGTILLQAEDEQLTVVSFRDDVSIAVAHAGGGLGLLAVARGRQRRGGRLPGQDGLPLRIELRGGRREGGTLPRDDGFGFRHFLHLRSTVGVVANDPETRRLGLRQGGNTGAQNDHHERTGPHRKREPTGDRRTRQSERRCEST